MEFELTQEQKMYQRAVRDFCEGELKPLMAFPREHLLFTMWYLSEKKLIRRDDRSNYEITSQGIDYVESNLGSNRVIYRLLKAAENGDTRSDDLRVWMSEPAGEEDTRVTQ